MAPFRRPVRVLLPVSVLALAVGAGCGAEERPGPGAPSPAPPPPPAPARVEPPVDPGRVTLHRLNRVEYDNTVRDLLGTALRPAEEFPADDRGHGFDNVADVLSLSPLQIELYQRAAERLAAEALQPGPRREALVPCDLAADGPDAAPCARGILGGLARRAYRRPLAPAELDRLVGLVQAARAEGDAPDVALGVALAAILVSPHFLFRVERDPDPASLAPHRLTGHELAARLSYFLWSTMPDAELAAAADAGALDGPDAAVAVAAQARRMLASPRAEALVEHFGGQWLFTRKLDDHEPDRKVWKGWDPALRESMRAETHLAFRALLRDGAPATRLLTGETTFLDDRLARHYGLPEPGSATPVLVDVAGTGRGGILGHGSLLTVTSYPARTSPVLRGHWVLEQLLCAAPPPPPPGVEGLKAEAAPTATLRQRLEQHRSDPSCAGCHSVMDPLGFGLEEFDGIGARRTTDGGLPLDVTGELPDGRRFRGARELATLLAADPRFHRCLVEKLVTYALGRGPTANDEPALAKIAQAFAARGGRFADLALAVTESDLFVKRRGELEEGGAP